MIFMPPAISLSASIRLPPHFVAIYYTYYDAVYAIFVVYYCDTSHFLPYLLLITLITFIFGYAYAIILSLFHIVLRLI